MAHVTRATASLRIYGDALDPDELSSWLHAQPNEAWRKGDPPMPGRPPIAHRTGGWMLRSDAAAEAPVEAHVRDVLDRMTDDVAVRQRIGRIYEADLFCGLFMEGCNEGFSLSPETLQMLADRTLSIGFDIYGIPLDEQATKLK